MLRYLILHHFFTGFRTFLQLGKTYTFCADVFTIRMFWSKNWKLPLSLLLLWKKILLTKKYYKPNGRNIWCKYNFPTTFLPLMLFFSPSFRLFLPTSARLYNSVVVGLSGLWYIKFYIEYTGKHKISVNVVLSECAEFLMTLMLLS